MKQLVLNVNHNKRHYFPLERLIDMQIGVKILSETEINTIYELTLLIEEHENELEVAYVLGSLIRSLSILNKLED